MSTQGNHSTGELSGWPPEDALQYVQSEDFLRLLVELAEQVEEQYGVPGGFSLVLDRVDRLARKNPRFFAKFATPKHLANYLRAALRNEAGKAARRWRRQMSLDPALLDSLHSGDESHPLAALSSVEFASAAREAIASLPPSEQEIVLAFLRCRSLRQAAAQVGLSESTARHRFSAALSRLADKLSGYVEE